MTLERYDTRVLASNRLGRYHLGERLGEGGMAEVFRAELAGAAGFTKAVAIKRVKPALATDERVCAMFLQEAQVARRMEHGGVVQVFDVGIEDGVPYLVIELVDGVSLDRILSDRHARRLDLAEALYLVEHVAAALHHAHQLTDQAGHPTPVVHRDVNPRNILVSRDGVVKLTDFGIAKAWHIPSTTLPGTVKGTLGYLSPEQSTGAPVDARTDQFSTGVVLHELLTGANPLAGSESLQAHCDQLQRGLPRIGAAGPLPPAIDDTLADIVARAVAVKPGDRFPSMEDLRSELEAWRVSRGIRTSASGLGQRVRAILGTASTHESGAVGRPVALGNALQAQLAARASGLPSDSVSTETMTVAPPPAPRRRRHATLAAGLAVLALGTAVAWHRLGPSAPPTSPASPAGPDPATASPAPSAGPAPATTASLAAPAPSTPAAAPSTAAAAPRAVTTQPAPGQPAPAADSAASLASAAPDAASPPVQRSRPPVRRPSASTPATEPAAEPGRLQINLIPYARVTIDGQSRGQTPVDLALPAGAHALVLDNPDTGQRRERQVEVVPGQTLVIHQW
jgi:serine/threonine protein kinase